MRPGDRPDLSDVQTRYRSSLVYVLCFTTLTFAVLGLITIALKAPVVFPPLAATAFILFAFPLAEESYPRNVLGSYVIGVLAGMAAVAIFGLWQTPSDLLELPWDRFGASILGMALAVAGITFLRALHVPAFAATVMVTLGIIYRPEQYGYMIVLVAVMIGVALAVNRAFGLKQALWSGPLVSEPKPSRGKPRPDAD